MYFRVHLYSVALLKKVAERGNFFSIKYIYAPFLRQLHINIIQLLNKLVKCFLKNTEKYFLKLYNDIEVII